MNGGKEEKQFGSVSFSEEETKNIGFHLSKKLGKDSTTSRTGAGNSRFTYIESWRTIQIANAIFGFNGWSCTVVDLTPDYIEECNGRYSVGVTAVVRVCLKDGTSHEDVGYGSGENPRKGAAIEKAKKEAVSDARKRALRLFGDALGNCLYDKSYLSRLKSGKGSGDDILDLNDLPRFDQSPIMTPKAEEQYIVKEEPNISSFNSLQEDINHNNNSGNPPEIIQTPSIIKTVKKEPIQPNKTQNYPPTRTVQPLAPRFSQQTQSNPNRYQPYPLKSLTPSPPNQNTPPQTETIKQFSLNSRMPAPFKISDRVNKPSDG